uniref:Uncharacterized protein n=1 Tax=viral metagenome TaxID=1070528 RepID=A0A6C0F348_9ZZZZ
MGGLERITSTWLIKNDMFLSILIIVLFIILCKYLYTTIVVNQYGVEFKPEVYLINRCTK